MTKRYSELKIAIIATLPLWGKTALFGSSDASNSLGWQESMG